VGDYIAKGLLVGAAAAITVARTVTAAVAAAIVATIHFHSSSPF